MKRKRLYVGLLLFGFIFLLVTVSSGTAENVWDVDGDNKLSLPDIVYGLQILSGVRINSVDIDDDGDGYTDNQGDCNDSNSKVHPGAPEICGDGIDQDCNGTDLVCDFTGSWSFYMTPQNGIEAGPYCIYITQNDNLFYYNDWHKDYSIFINGNITGSSITMSGESSYYGDTICYSATAVAYENCLMVGTYNYTGTFSEDGKWKAIKTGCKQSKGWVRVGNIQGDYALDFYLWDLIDDGISISSATAMGPNIGTLNLNINSQTSYFLGQTQPIAGEIYTFNVNYSDGTIETITGSVRDTFVDFPIPLSPADGEIISTFTPTFTWQPPSCECQGYYRIWVVDSQGNDVWSVYPSKETTSVVYNFDGQGKVLQSGETYEWRLIAFDEPISGGPDNNVWVLNTFTVQ